MSASIEIICGVEGSGKTTRLLRRYREELLRLQREASPGQAVWITPTHRSAREVLRALLDESLRACFAPHVFTFESFAERILRTAGMQVAELSSVGRRMIARALIDEAKSDGTLKYFAPVSDTSGFLDLLLGFFADLKRDETWPAQFDEACRRRGALPRDMELANLYGRYQARLNELGVYDAEGRFWSARAALSEGRRGEFGRLSLVIVDGFADFTQPQYEILAHLADAADRLIVSLPLEEPSVRSDLFAKSAAARDEIARRRAARLTCVVREAINSPATSHATLAHLADHLFDNPRTVPRLANASGIEIIAASGPRGEARAVTERVKELLLAGVPASDIVIALRDVDQNADFLAEMLSAAGVPYWCQTRTRVSETPLARALFAVLQNELDDWAFGRLCAVLRSSYFRPDRGGWEPGSSRDKGRAIQTTIDVLRERKLGSNRARILERLSAIAAGEEDATKKHRAATALALLRKISDATERLRRPAHFADWTDRIAGLCGDLGLDPHRGRAPHESAARTPPDRFDLDERDREQWRGLKEILYDAARTLTLTGDGRELTLPEFVRQFRDILSSQTFGTASSDAGKVLVLEATDVRNVDVPYLFLAGLSESSFPRSRPDDCLFAEADRRRYVRKGGPEAIGLSQQQDEMLLFYSIVTRARCRLTLSYTSVSAAGQPLFPSPYVGDICDLFESGALSPDSPPGALDPVPPSARMLTAGDLRLVATEEVRERRPGLFVAMAQQPELAPVARAIAASAAMDAARFEQHGFSAHEGMLQQDANIRRLAARFSPDYQFSTTQLESYANCPFRFLLSHVLQIEPLPPAEPDGDPRTRGLWLHQVLADLHDPQRSRPNGPSGSAHVTDALERLIAEHFAEMVEFVPLERSLLLVEQRFAELFAALYGRQYSAYRESLGNDWSEFPQPQFVELEFGDVPQTGEPARPRLPSFLTFGEGEFQVRVRGKIDRVDVGRRGTNTAFAVIDYKTRQGRSFDLEDVASGVALQLAIYASAIRRSGVLGAQADLFQIAYWNLTRSGCVGALKGSSKKRLGPINSSLAENIEQLLHAVVPKIAFGIRSGQFPVHNADRTCTNWCPYSTVCRVNQIRSIEKEREKQWGLAAR
jgi:ATP-dependent helicase/nuclease subunit B